MRTGAVVVGVDGSDAAGNAARWAAAVASRYNTSLHIVHALPAVGHNLTDTVAAMRAAVLAHQRENADAILRRAEEIVRAQETELEVTTLSTDVPITEVLVELGKSARMIVVGNDEVTAAGALLLGSTTLAVATRADCPVVAWRGSNLVPTDDPVVVGVDGTPSSLAALENAFEFCERFNAKLAAVRSTSSPLRTVAARLPLLIDWDALETAEWAQLTNDVDRYNQRYPQVSAPCFVEHAKPAAALIDRSHADGAQLLVVGSHRKPALTSAILGSTALNLLQHATVPVMVCRPSR
ncbi:universal stress protein [Mycolicibacterium novocastrense]|uniref:Universal stress protein n=1 Tax=Mycolicibacterium novocastrense TaxID=59813 RepID=A0AAW5SP42_MYCNV|nr:universal stress protein [Mycolicibacterium novocastrense]MCV7024817.1 universal stress protein [Mycolicibacterium novocastrense]GAT12797.1 UspA domain-containing protein [Mycolicibacterium novocastrense]